MLEGSKQVKEERVDRSGLSARERLIAAALDLFEEEGFHAVGIDRILRNAGVAKMTLYNHFPSKQALIVTVLERKLEDYFAWLDQALSDPRLSARDRLLAVFDAMSRLHGGPDFRGCLFLKASGEYPEFEDPVHAVAAEHKRRCLARLTGLASAAGAASPRLLAQRLLLLCEGATSLAQILGGAEAARQARDTAALLLRQMLPEAPSSRDRETLA
ncbi:MAG: TetR/AcrR family transcriptional regulator [Kiloniellales bacterium]